MERVASLSSWRVTGARSGSTVRRGRASHPSTDSERREEAGGGGPVVVRGPPGRRGRKKRPKTVLFGGRRGRGRPWRLLWWSPDPRQAPGLVPRPHPPRRDASRTRLTPSIPEVVEPRRRVGWPYPRQCMVPASGRPPVGPPKAPRSSGQPGFSPPLPSPPPGTRQKAGRGRPSGMQETGVLGRTRPGRRRPAPPVPPELGWEPEATSGCPPTPSLEKSSRTKRQLFPARIYGSAPAWSASRESALAPAATAGGSPTTQTEWQTKAAPGEGPAGTLVYRADAARRLRPRLTWWRNQRAEASPEPRLRATSAGLSSARPRRPVSPSCPSTERPSAPASSVGLQSAGGAPMPAAGTSRHPPETRFLEPSRVSAAPGGHERTAAQRGPDRRRWQILSTRVQRKARGTVRRSARPRAAHPAGRRAPRRPARQSCGGQRGACVLSAPEPPRRGNPPGHGASRLSKPPGRNRRPTWLILPVAYACLKD